MRYSQYRDYFANVSRYLKLGVFCKECGIPHSNLSTFIKYGTRSISLDRLQYLYNYIQSIIVNIA